MTAPTLYETEALILDRLRAQCAPGSILLGTLQPVDMSDDSGYPVVAKLMLYRIDQGGSPSPHARNVRLEIGYAFSVYCDTARASVAQQQEAFDLLQAAGSAMVGWALPSSIPGQTSGRHVQIATGPESGNDGRVTRLSLGFTVPAHLVGS